MDCNAFVTKAYEMGASDIHLVCGLNPRCRVDGALRDLDDWELESGDCDVIAQQLCGNHFSELEEVGEFDTARDIAGIRCRINLFRQQGNYSVVIRIINDHIPTVEELKLPAIVKEFHTYKHGIVLITGETGSGKSTTLAAILAEINHNEYKHILTLEDPIEYIHVPDKCVINQREVGKDTKSFSNGLRAALREDPDVILVGEMRDLETIETALMAAETGHLVFGTVHTNSAADSIDRLVDIFPANRQTQIRLQLAQSLRAVLSQQLIPMASGNGRVVCCEIMKVENSIRTLIRESKTFQIPNAIITTASIGNITMESAMKRLLEQRLITKAAYDAAIGTVNAIPPAQPGPSGQKRPVAGPARPQQGAPRAGAPSVATGARPVAGAAPRPAPQAQAPVAINLNRPK